MGSYKTHEVPVIVRGEGAYVWDQHGRRYLDGLAGLFTTQARDTGATELAEAAARQASDARVLPDLDLAHPRAIELAERLGRYAPGELNHVFFTRRVRAVESALGSWHRQYFALITGQPQRTKVISRDIAYHGTTCGALTLLGIPSTCETPFEPIPFGGAQGPEHELLPGAPLFADDEEASANGSPTDLSGHPRRGAPRPSPPCTSSRCRTSGGCLPRRRRATSSGCARSATSHGVLFVSDEVLCRLRAPRQWFGAIRYGTSPTSSPPPRA